MEINSKEYWENRFKSGSWDEYDGSAQTMGFANIILENLPGWFRAELNKGKLSLFDAGCAKGELVHSLKKEFSSCTVTGMDFSESAVKYASETYKNCGFECGDITNLSKDYDIIFSSNTLEHFDNPSHILKGFFAHAKSHVVLLLPFEEYDLISEHVSFFDFKSFPLVSDGYVLTYYKTSGPCPVWPGHQILLIYTRNEIAKDFSLNDTYTDFRKEIETLKQELETLKQENTEKTQEIEEQKQENIRKTLEIEEQKQENIRKTLEIKEQKQENIRKTLEIETKDSQISALESTVINTRDTLNKTKGELEKKIREIESELKLAHAEKETLKKDISALSSRIDTLTNDAARLSDEKAILSENLNHAQQTIRNAMSEAHSLANTKNFKMAHFINRLKMQFFKGDKADKKAFFKWLRNRNHTHDSKHLYNQLFNIVHILETYKDVPKPKTESVFLNTYDAFKTSYYETVNSPLTEVSKQMREIIDTRSYKGIIVYPHTIHWDTMQTPQHLLREFAKLGYLCLFGEHNNIPVQLNEVEPNLFVLKEKDLIQSIYDKPVIVLCTWMCSMGWVDELENKILWYHILDKINIFAYYDHQYEQKHNEVIRNADLITYVAHELERYIPDDIRSYYLPNGTNVSDFMNIHDDLIPEDFKEIVESGKKIAGYYGLISHWFDMEMMINLAERNPDINFVFIGDYVRTEPAPQLPNMFFMGKKPYKELSDYAKFFDCAIIPFEISDMMDCVSPIKFFEYRALGLPVVSSYMKEMQQYEAEDVIIAHGTDSFEKAIYKTFDPEIRRISKDTGMDFAIKQQWSMRAQVVDEQLKTLSYRHCEADFNKPYDKCDILLLSVIDYSFRHQRPQHFAQSLADNGHRVFYIETLFDPEATKVLRNEGNLKIINLKNPDAISVHTTDFKNNPDLIMQEFDKLIYRYAIKDCLIMVDYPTWILPAKELKNKYGFKIIADYMDDYTGFEATTGKMVVDCCKELLKVSDHIITSSAYLEKSARKFSNRVSVIRNGTEYQHFAVADKNIKKPRKIVGYYGAIAHWFDFEKVIFAANQNPDADFVLIGEVTEGYDILKEVPNIRLLGEIPYKDLPDELAKFDVALIPFDTSTDLIKATNPVKFYEYLSACKKVVATDIPELYPYRNKLCYLASTKEEFSDYISLCLSGKDTLSNKKEMTEFARENDWQARAEALIKRIDEVFPKISIVVLTYNNLDYNKKCIESILNRTAYPNYELIVVDNLSTDGTRDYLKTLNHPKIKVILNENNLGFAAGNNVGIKAADGKYIMLLNNDTEVTAGYITNMIKHIEQNGFKMVGPVTNSIGNESMINVSYADVSGCQSFSHLYTHSHMNELYTDIRVLAMFCVVFEKSLTDEVGLLDENYGIGMFEDDDYSLAVRRKGYKIACCEDAFVHHYGQASFKILGDKKYMDTFNKNKTYFENKWREKFVPHKFRDSYVAPEK